MKNVVGDNDGVLRRNRSRRRYPFTDEPQRNRRNRGGPERGREKERQSFGRLPEPCRERRVRAPHNHDDNLQRHDASM